MHVRVGRAGRVVIPADVRRALGIDMGDALVLTVETDDGGTPTAARLETVAAAVARAQAVVARYVQPGERLLSEELIAERRHAAETE